MDKEQFDYGENERRVVVRSHDFTERQFSIDAQDMPTILRFLRSKVYSDKILAVVREYSTNAFDAHVDAGKKDLPIRVTLPTKLSPQYCVRDFGESLTEEEMWNLYIYFGKSTKREDRDQTGTLGIGCKAAFAYRDNFVVVTYKHGKKSTYLAQIDESDQGKLMKISEEDTDESDGVEIIVDVFQKDISSFRSKALKLFRYFTVLPEVLNVGDDIIEKDPILLSGDGWSIRKPRIVSTSYGSSYTESLHGCMTAVMGNIPYTVRSDLVEGTPRNVDILLDFSTLCVEFPNGTIDFELSREGLEYNKKTQKNILLRMDEVIQDMIQNISQEFVSCQDLWEAKAKYYSLRKGLDSELFGVFSSQITWKGVQNLGSGFDRIPSVVNKGDVIIREYSYTDAGNLRCKNIQSFLASDDSKLCFNGEDPITHIASKTRTLLADEDISLVYVLIFKDDTVKKDYDNFYQLHAFSKDNYIDLDTIERTKKTYGSTTKSSGVSYSRAHISAFELSPGYKGNLSACWSNSEINGTPGVYVPIYRMDVSTADKKPCKYHAPNLASLLSDVLEIDTTVKVYGIRCKDITSLDGAWKHVSVYVSELIESFRHDPKVKDYIATQLAYYERKNRLRLESFLSDDFRNKFLSKLDADNVIRKLFDVLEISGSKKDGKSQNLVNYFSIVKWSDEYLDTQLFGEFDIYNLPQLRKDIQERYPLVDWVAKSGYSYYWSDELYTHMLQYIRQADMYYDHSTSC